VEAEPAAPVRPRQSFTSGSEQVIATVMNTRLGRRPPPLFNLPMAEDIGKVLDRDIVLYDDDDERAVEAKANVAHAKQLLKEYIRDGGRPEDFLRHYHGILQEAYEEWNTAQRHVLALLLEGRQGEAELYAEDQTRTFAERGIQPVNIPPNFRQQH
jgi:hypothetical protein